MLKHRYSPQSVSIRDGLDCTNISIQHFPLSIFHAGISDPMIALLQAEVYISLQTSYLQTGVYFRMLSQITLLC
jgi:hypothetical protein